MKLSAPAKTHRRGYWLIALIAIVLIAATSWIQHQSFQSILVDRDKFELQRRADEAARIIADMRETFQAKMIALAEQRGLRQGAMDWSDRKTSRDFFAGFSQAFDASCRAITAESPGIKNFSLRDLDGQKIAGSGADTIPIDFPEIMERIRVKTSIAENGDYTETFIIPIRDVNAKPIVFLYAEVNPSGYGKAVMRLITISEGDLFCLQTASGIRIWTSDKAMQIPSLDREMDQFRLDNVIYNLVHAEIQGTDWIIYLAEDSNKINPTYSRAYRISAIWVLASALILCITTLLIYKNVPDRLS